MKVSPGCGVLGYFILHGGGTSRFPRKFSEVILALSVLAGHNKGMGTLITLQGPETGQKFSLDQPSTILGRQFDCTVVLQGRAVSRQHAQIVQRDGRYFVE